MTALELIFLALVGVVLFFAGMKRFVTREPDSEARDRGGCLMVVVGLIAAVASVCDLIARALS